VTSYTAEEAKVVVHAALVFGLGEFAVFSEFVGKVRSCLPVVRIGVRSGGGCIGSRCGSRIPIPEVEVELLLPEFGILSDCFPDFLSGPLLGFLEVAVSWISLCVIPNSGR
jgi:hypothetical protein